MDSEQGNDREKGIIQLHGGEEAKLSYKQVTYVRPEEGSNYTTHTMKE